MGITVDLEMTYHIASLLIKDLVRGEGSNPEGAPHVSSTLVEDLLEDLFVLPVLRSEERAVLLVKPGVKKLVIGKGGSRVKEIENKHGVRLTVVEYTGEDGEAVNYATKMVLNYVAVKSGMSVLVRH